MTKIRTYKYGLLAPTDAGLVDDQMRRGHNYFNKLIEAEIKRRDAIRTALKDKPNVEIAFEKLRYAQEAYDLKEKEIKTLKAQNYLDKTKTLRDQEKQVKKQIRAKSTVQLTNDLQNIQAQLDEILNQQRPNLDTTLQSLKEQLKDLKLSVRQAEKEVKEARKLNNDDKVKQVKETAHQEYLTTVRNIHHDKNVRPWYGTYMLIEEAMEKVKKMPLYDGVNDNNPYFRRWDGGRCGIQHFQPHEEMSEVIETIDTKPSSTMIQITLCPPPTQSLKSDGQPRKIGNQDYRLLKLRVESKR